MGPSGFSKSNMGRAFLEGLRVSINRDMELPALKRNDQPGPDSVAWMACYVSSKSPAVSVGRLLGVSLGSDTTGRRRSERASGLGGAIDYYCSPSSRQQKTKASLSPCIYMCRGPFFLLLFLLIDRSMLVLGDQWTGSIIKSPSASAISFVGPAFQTPSSACVQDDAVVIQLQVLSMRDPKSKFTLHYLINLPTHLNHSTNSQQS